MLHVQSPAAPLAAAGTERRPPQRARIPASGVCRSRRSALHVCATSASKQAHTTLRKGEVLPVDAAAASQRSQPAQPGLSYVRGPTEVPLLEETVGQRLDRTAQAFPDRDALVSLHQGLRLSWRQLHEQAELAARGLLAMGVQKLDRVGIWAPNCAEWAVLQYATAKVGAILVNINPAYRSAELAYALRQAGVSVLVLAPGLRGSRDFVGMAAEAAAELPQLRARVLLGGGAPEGFSTWDALLAAGEGESLAAALQARGAELRPEDPINIQYTSGTTGFPKAATLSHRNILNNAAFIARTCRYSEADRVCIPVPLYHCFGMVIGNLACACSGAAAVYPSEAFSPEAALSAVQAERCTSLYGVPTMFIAELALPSFKQYRLDSLRTGVMAGSPCPVEVMKKVRTEMHMSEVTICYGMTETSPVSFQTSADDPVERRVSTVGRIHPHLEARVVDPGSGRVLPHGSVGELQVRGYSVMVGYWGDEAATRQSVDAEGWMRTGDLATLDPQGYCCVVGRIKDMIIRGGENIFPREIEEFLYGHPAVADVQVFGVPSRLYGEQVCAWVRLREGAEDVGRAELRAWCRGRIARHKVPRYWKLVDSFPMTVSGKPQKYKMREAAIAELGLPPPRK